MAQQNFNNMKDKLDETDIEAILEIIASKCRVQTVNRLRSILKYGRSTIPEYGILNRLIHDEYGWSYCAGQSYTDEIRTVREIILNGK